MGKAQLQPTLWAAGFGNNGCTLGGTMGKGRERQIVLKTDQRTVLLEMGLGGKFQQKSSAYGTRTEPFSKAMFFKSNTPWPPGC
jgi:hypothetical protein